MTSQGASASVFQLRTDRMQALDSDPGLLALDWWRGDQRSTVHATGTFLQKLAPSAVASDLLTLATGVYCADKLVLRSDAPDGFTREIELRVPVSDARLFDTARSALQGALRFLTGDKWTLRFRRVVPPARRRIDSMDADAVCLFSGGLDSLSGAIDLLSDGASLLLLGHHEGGITSHKQVELARRIGEHHGESRACLYQLFLTPASHHAGQATPLPQQREETTRGRSLLFIAAAIALADTVGPFTPVYIPENGFIGINVPLVPARTGALSTRTTHPYFLAQLTEVLGLLGLDAHRLENPYRLETKGEVLAGSHDPTLLGVLASESLSCAHPTAGRWIKLAPGNCGYCWPCLIRRASMHHAGWDQPDGYAWDALNDPSLLDGANERGASLRAMLASLTAPADRYAVLRNGSIPNREAAAFDATYRRGRQELVAWVRATGPPLLHDLLVSA